MYTIITFLKDIVNYTGTLFPQVLEGLKVTMETNFIYTFRCSCSTRKIIKNKNN